MLDKWRTRLWHAQLAWEMAAVASNWFDVTVALHPSCSFVYFNAGSTLTGPLSSCSQPSLTFNYIDAKGWDVDDSIIFVLASWHTTMPRLWKKQDPETHRSPVIRQYCHHLYLSSSSMYCIRSYPLPRQQLPCVSVFPCESLVTAFVVRLLPCWETQVPADEWNIEGLTFFVTNHDLLIRAQS